jgi:hypothetical protein
MTPEQLARFRARVESLGASFDEAMATHISTQGATEPVVLSMDLDRTVLPPRVLVVRDVATLKSQGGVSDAAYGSGLSDNAIAYPPTYDRQIDKLLDRARSRAELRALLGAERQRTVRQALDAWLLGNSARVRDYERVINAAHFPTYAAAWTLASICVAAGTTVTLVPPPNTPDPPTLVVTGDVCIEEGGLIQSLVPVTVEVHGQMRIVDAHACKCPPRTGRN